MAILSFEVLVAKNSLKTLQNVPFGDVPIGLNSLKFLETDTLLRWILTLLIKWTPPGVGGCLARFTDLRDFSGKNTDLRKLS